jgi:hypothetical protein
MCWPLMALLAEEEQVLVELHQLVVVVLPFLEGLARNFVMTLGQNHMMILDLLMSVSKPSSKT